MIGINQNVELLTFWYVLDENKKDKRYYQCHKFWSHIYNCFFFNILQTIKQVKIMKNEKGT